ncbi:hypothetical protein KC331_g5078 [Hortaea werneckii]|nr:hypothetical protein KC331_g5078 [Hortaea werneckii]KAI7717628.1 hypothetical protein KC353_g4425 [Hortaea werneckii]
MIANSDDVQRMVSRLRQVEDGADFHGASTSGNGDDTRNKAFQQALKGRTDQEREKFGRATHIADVFERLQTEHSRSVDESVFRKGLSRTEPVLRKLDFTLDRLDPVISIEPSVSAALAIVQMVTKVAVLVCGAVQEVQSQIVMFLEALPRIDRCDAVQSGVDTEGIVPEALSLVYGDLFDFYFHCCKVLESRHITRNEVRSRIRGEIDQIVKSFSCHLDSLDKSVNFDTYGLSVDTNVVLHRQDVRDQDKEVQGLLRATDAETRYFDGLREPFEDACRWVKSNELFQDWLKATPRTRHVMICGNMGVGKTSTMAYVEKRLRSGEFDPMKPLVCSYFCKEVGEMNEAKSIYRSILLQLFNADESVRRRTNKWYKERQGQGRTQIDPTDRTDELRKHLVTLVTSLPQALYIVIDALDECSDEARAELKTFFQAVCPDPHKLDAESPADRGRSGSVRLLTSSRYADDAQGWNALETISMRPDKDRDLLLVKCFVSQDLKDLGMDLSVLRLVEKTVAHEMQGSALWARMAIRWLKTVGDTKEARVRVRLQDIPPREMASLYAKLFERVVAGEETNRKTLGLCLDLLAGAQRPLTLRELSYAAETSRGETGERVTSLGKIRDLEDHKRILHLVRPFIGGISNGEIDPNTSITLVHQSLRQTIMRSPPREWIEVALGNKTQNDKPVREAELNGLLLRHCMDYLLLEEFDKQELINATEEEAQEDEYSFWLRIAPGLGNSPVFGTSLVSEDFDPYDKGFGGFYTYAACYWTDHYAAVTQEYDPDCMDVVALLQPASLRRENWVNRRYQDGYLYPNSEDFKNPIVFVASWGTMKALEDLVRRGLETLGLGDEELCMAATKATERSICQGRFQAVELLLNHPSTTSRLDGYDIFVSLLQAWRCLSSDQRDKWQLLLKMVVDRFQSTLVRFANDLLLQSAWSGCLPMAEKLFEEARSDQRIERCLLQPTNDDLGPIGRAAMFGKTEVVEYLCQQKGVEPHLHHRDHEGDNIYYAVARNGNADVLRVLIRYFPEGVNDAKDYLTPLRIAVGHARCIEAARVLLIEGKADVNAGGPYYMPLSRAIRNGDMDMCRMLIVEGKADPWVVVGITEHPEQPDSKVPVLLEEMVLPGLSQQQKREREQQMLKEICALMPLAVSMETLE